MAPSGTDNCTVNTFCSDLIKEQLSELSENKCNTEGSEMTVQERWKLL